MSHPSLSASPRPPRLGANPRHLSGILSTWVFALLPANLVPPIIGTLTGDLGVDLTVAGAAATGMTLANAVGVLAVGPVVSRGHRVAVARIGVLILVVPAVVAAVFLTPPVVLSALVVGGFGLGALIGAASASIAGAHDPDRATTTAIVVNRLVVAAVLIVLPFFGGDIRAILLLLVGFGIIAFSGSAWVSLRENDLPIAVADAATSASAATVAGSRIAAWAVAVSFALWTVSEEGVYGVTTVIMSTHLPMLDESGVYAMLALEVVAGLVGAVSAPLLLRLWGRTPALSVVLGASIAAKLVMMTTHEPELYIAGVVVWGLTFGASIPLVFGLAAKLSVNGSANVLVNGIYVIGVALGPLVSTQVTEAAGIGGLTVVMTIIGVVAAGALIAATVRSAPIVAAVWKAEER